MSLNGTEPLETWIELFVEMASAAMSVSGRKPTMGVGSVSTALIFITGSTWAIQRISLHEVVLDVTEGRQEVFREMPRMLPG